MEFARKAFHVGMCAAAAALTWILPPTAARILIGSAAAIALGTELARRYSRSFDALFHRFFGSLIRPAEAQRLTGATFMAVGFTVAILLVSTDKAAAVFLFAALCDPVASFIGRRFGRHRLPFGKSLEGSFAFLATGLLLTSALPNVDFAEGAIASLAMTLTEAAPLEDNLAVPIVGALAFRLLSGLP